MIFSKNFKELRLSTKTPQKDIAEYLNVSVRAIQRYERGDTEPTFEQLVLIAKFFNVSTDYLLGVKDS